MGSTIFILQMGIWIIVAVMVLFIFTFTFIATIGSTKRNNVEDATTIKDELNSNVNTNTYKNDMYEDDGLYNSESDDEGPIQHL